jgi:hypothetical protein
MVISYDVLVVISVVLFLILLLKAQHKTSLETLQFLLPRAVRVMFMVWIFFLPRLQELVRERLLFIQIKLMVGIEKVMGVQKVEMVMMQELQSIPILVLRKFMIHQRMFKPILIFHF